MDFLFDLMKSTSRERLNRLLGGRKTGACLADFGHFAPQLSRLWRSGIR